VIGAAGAGGVIGGVLLAARDPRVTAAGTKLGASLLGSLEQDAAPFIEPVLKAIDTVENRFQQMNGRISSIFSKSSGFLDPLVDGALDGVEGILRGVDALVRRGKPVMESFGRAFATIGDSIGNAFETISGGSEDAATALDYTARTIGAFIEVTGYLIRGLTETFGVITYIPSKLLLVSDALSRATGIGREYNLGAQQTGDASVRAADGVAGLVNKANGLYYAYSSSGEAMDRTNQYLADSEKAMADAEKAAYDLITANHSLYTSEIDVEQAVADANKSRKENGKTLDLHTQKGRDNARALDAVGAAARSQYDAFVQLNKEGPASAALADKLRAQFVKTATSFGVSADEANRMAAEIYGIPPKKDVKIKTESNAVQVSRETKKALDMVNSKRINIDVVVNTSRLASIENRLNRLGGSMYNAAGASWAALDSNSGTARTGGPTPVNVSSNVAVSLDGAPFYAMTVRAAEARSERDAWRQKVGRR
jgi:hypothetical protein